MHCLNCNTLNPLGVDRCVACRIPGDFGTSIQKREQPQETAHVSCSNCASLVPNNLHKCPKCRWQLATTTQTVSTIPKSKLKRTAKSRALPGIEHRKII